MPRTLAVLLALMTLATAASAQVIIEPYEPNGETTGVSGPYARYQRHVLKLAAHRYAVLFEPGYVDAETARRAVAPLCAAQGRQALVAGTVAPVDLVFVEGRPDVLQGVRVDCV